MITFKNTPDADVAHTTVVKQPLHSKYSCLVPVTTGSLDAGSDWTMDIDTTRAIISMQAALHSIHGDHSSLLQCPRAVATSQRHPPLPGSQPVVQQWGI